jgi:hypothetical protein
MTHTEDLILRLRDTASRGVSAWGDLQQEAADELETLMNAVAAEREACAEVAKEQAAKYAPGGSLHTMMNIDITRAAAAACEHVAHLINERGQA